jgi:8-oxo-dGTP pyrophosphatase MutT (NUDIX family)
MRQKSIEARTVGSSAFAAEKIGAGFLFCCGGEVLLLLRRSKHNDKTWGLAGGNADAGETLEQVALRESFEEMGSVPGGAKEGDTGTPFLTVRGKRMQKHYTVFVKHISAEAKAAFVPQLNEEHREWKWIAASQVALSAHASREELPLHPVVALLFNSQPDAMEVAALAQQAYDTPDKVSRLLVDSIDSLDKVSRHQAQKSIPIDTNTDYCLVAPLAASSSRDRDNR